jgi:26S proteasome regulatory subunit N2
MAHFGAALSQGFVDTGGHNITISLQSWTGSRNTSAIVVLFCQFWYWYPLVHLAFKPIGIIGLNADLKVSFDG